MFVGLNLTNSSTCQVKMTRSDSQLLIEKSLNLGKCTPMVGPFRVYFGVFLGIRRGVTHLPT